MDPEALARYAFDAFPDCPELQINFPDGRYRVFTSPKPRDGVRLTLDSGYLQQHKAVREAQWANEAARHEQRRDAVPHG